MAVRHSTRLAESFDQLTQALARLSQVYEGAGASDFKAHFARTQAGLEEYLEGTRSIQRILQDRIDRLAEADRADL